MRRQYITSDIARIYLEYDVYNFIVFFNLSWPLKKLLLKEKNYATKNGNRRNNRNNKFASNIFYVKMEKDMMAKSLMTNN